MPIDDENPKRAGTRLNDDYLHSIVAAVNGALAAVKAAGGTRAEPMEAKIVPRQDGELYLVFRVLAATGDSYHVFREVESKRSQQNCQGVPTNLHEQSNDAWDKLWPKTT